MLQRVQQSIQNLGQNVATIILHNLKMANDLVSDEASRMPKLLVNMMVHVQKCDTLRTITGANV